MPAYSRDLRQRVIDTVERNEGSLRQIASRFLVSISFVTRLLRLHRDTGSVAPKPHGGGRRAALGPADLQRLRELIADQPDATLEELRQRLGVGCSIMAISRALRKLKITRKKKDLHAQDRDSPKVKRKRRAFRKEVAGIDPQRLVFQALVPQLQAGDVVIWDNLKPHKAKAVVSAVEGAGAHVLPLPPWSSDMTPIEEMYSKVKGTLRSVAARTTETLTAAIGSALHDISAPDILGWFQSRAAYAMQS
jgi:transposase